MINFIGAFKGLQFVIICLAFILVVVISFTLHEFAHAYAAYKCGDNTPKAMGRLTINPIKHIDPLGFICCILFGIGWAKPVPINPLKFRNYKKGLFITSIAGITVNYILAFISYPLFLVFNNLYVSTLNNALNFLAYFFLFMYSINIMLFVFNLLPIYPLDGFNMISALTKYDNKFIDFMRKYGSIILLSRIYA